MESLKSYVSSLETILEASSTVHKCALELVEELVAILDEEIDWEMIREQVRILFSILKTPAKLSILTDVYHLKLIISFFRQGGIEHYKYSYYNRAKLSPMHIQKLEEVGPIVFSEAVMIASKLNTINKNSSRIYTEDHLYC